MSDIDDVTTSLCLVALSLGGGLPGVPLDPFGMSGCNYYLAASPGPALHFVGVAAGGTAQLAFPIGINPSFAGSILHAQAAPLTPGLNPAGLVTSNGLCLTIGAR